MKKLFLIMFWPAFVIVIVFFALLGIATPLFKEDEPSDLGWVP